MNEYKNKRNYFWILILLKKTYIYSHVLFTFNCSEGLQIKRKISIFDQNKFLSYCNTQHIKLDNGNKFVYVQYMYMFKFLLIQN